MHRALQVQANVERQEGLGSLPRGEVGGLREDLTQLDGHAQEGGVAGLEGGGEGVGGLEALVLGGEGALVRHGA